MACANEFKGFMVTRRKALASTRSSAEIVREKHNFNGFQNNAKATIASIISEYTGTCFFSGLLNTRKNGIAEIKGSPTKCNGITRIKSSPTKCNEITGIKTSPTKCNGVNGMKVLPMANNGIPGIKTFPIKKNGFNGLKSLVVMNDCNDDLSPKKSLLKSIGGKRNGSITFKSSKHALSNKTAKKRRVSFGKTTVKTFSEQDYYAGEKALLKELAKSEIQRNLKKALRRRNEDGNTAQIVISISGKRKCFTSAKKQIKKNYHQPKHIQVVTLDTNKCVSHRPKTVLSSKIIKNNCNHIAKKTKSPAINKNPKSSTTNKNPKSSTKNMTLKSPTKNKTKLKSEPKSCGIKQSSKCPSKTDDMKKRSQSLNSIARRPTEKPNVPKTKTIKKFKQSYKCPSKTDGMKKGSQSLNSIARRPTGKPKFPKSKTIKKFKQSSKCPSKTDGTKNGSQSLNSIVKRPSGRPKGAKNKRIRKCKWNAGHWEQKNVYKKKQSVKETQKEKDNSCVKPFDHVEEKNKDSVKNDVKVKESSKQFHPLKDKEIKTHGKRGRDDSEDRIEVKRLRSTENNMSYQSLNRNTNIITKRSPPKAVKKAEVNTTGRRKVGLNRSPVTACSFEDTKCKESNMKNLAQKKNEAKSPEKSRVDDSEDRKRNLRLTSREDKQSVPSGKGEDRERNLRLRSTGQNRFQSRKGKSSINIISTSKAFEKAMVDTTDKVKLGVHGSPRVTHSSNDAETRATERTMRSHPKKEKVIKTPQKTMVDNNRGRNLRFRTEDKQSIKCGKTESRKSIISIKPQPKAVAKGKVGITVMKTVKCKNYFKSLPSTSSKSKREMIKEKDIENLLEQCMVIYKKKKIKKSVASHNSKQYRENYTLLNQLLKNMRNM